MKKQFDSGKMERARRALERSENKYVNQVNVKPDENFSASELIDLHRKNGRLFSNFSQYSRGDQEVIDLFLSVYNHKSVTEFGRKAIINYLNEIKSNADDVFKG